MNWNSVEACWEQLKGKVQWDTLTHERLDKRTKLTARIREASPKEAALPRRAVLLGALAAGCALLMPTVRANPATPAEAKKVSKKSVKYQTQPKGGQKCSGCLNFIAESNTCKLVEGQISPTGWCVLWTKKA